MNRTGVEHHRPCGDIFMSASPLPSETDSRDLDVIAQLVAAPGTRATRVAAAMRYLHEQRRDYHWVGVYVLEGQELVLDPYAGPETNHVRIPVGRGVCGTAV